MLVDVESSRHPETVPSDRASNWMLIYDHIIKLNLDVFLIVYSSFNYIANVLIYTFLILS